MSFTIHNFEDSIVELDIEKSTAICKELIKRSKPEDLFNAIGKALDVVGQRYENGEYFLSELIMAGELVREVLKSMGTLATLKPEGRAQLGTVVLATVKGDIHEIGKNIVGMLLRSSGFNVIDLGADVAADDIANSVKQNGAPILGLSALLTTTVPEFGKVVTSLRKQGLKEKTRTIVGGAAVDRRALEYGVDAWARTAIDGLRICKGTTLLHGDAK